MAKKFKNKNCNLCNNIFTPTSPKQKFCVECKDTATKISQSKRDKKRYKTKQSSKIVYSKECPACNTLFNTYYKSKKYCGEDLCEAFRIKLKNKNTHNSRDKQYMLDKGRKYYKDNRTKCLLHKANQYRENNPDAIQYKSGKINKHDITYVKEVVEKYKYKLLSTEYINNRELICT